MAGFLKWHPQQESAAGKNVSLLKRVVSLGETVRLRFEPESEAEASEQVDSDEYERKQSHQHGSAFFGTRNRNQPQEKMFLF